MYLDTGAQERAAMATLRKLSPDPDMVQKKLDLANNAGPLLGISKPFIYKNSDEVAKKLYGPFDNTGSAAAKLKGTLESIPLQAQMNALQYKQLNEGETPERDQEIKNLQSQMPKAQLGGFPKFIVDAAAALGIQTGAGAVGATSAMQAFGAGILKKQWYMKALGLSEAVEKTEKDALGVAEGATNLAMGSLIGGFYGELRDAGVGPQAAKAASGAMLAAQTVLGAVSVEKIPGVKQASEALVEASLRAAASGGMAKAVAAQAGKAYVEQAGIAALNSGVGALLPQLARSLSNRVDGTELTWDSAEEIWSQFSSATLNQTLAMGTVGALGATIQGTRMAGALGKIEREVNAAPEPSQSEAGGVKSASETPKAAVTSEAPKSPELEALKAEEAATQKALDEAPISDILDTGDNVPRGTPEASAEGPLAPETPAAEADPRVLKAQEMRPVLEKDLAAEQAKPEPDAARIEALQQAIKTADANVQKVQNQVADEQFVTNYPKAVEARAALETAIADPAQTDKIAGLAEALASAKKEANMMAAERGRVRVSNERARVERRDSVNKMIKDINEIDISEIPNEYKKPIADLMEQFTTDNPTNKTLEGLALIKQDIENGVNPAEFTKKQLARLGELSKKNLRDLTTDELTAVHDAIMGYQHAGRRQVAIHEKGRDIYFNGLEEADPKAFKAGLEEYQASHPDLSPEDAYAQFSEKNRGAIDIIAEEIDKAHPDTSVPKYGTKTPTERGKESIKKLLDWGKASNLGYETMGSVLAKGEDSLLYKVVVKPIDDGETVYSDKKHEYSAPFTQAAKDQKIGTYDWHHEKVKVDIPGLPSELERADILALAGIKASGGNLGESGFILKKDWSPGKVYKLTDNDLDALFSKLDDGDKAYLDLMYAQGKKGGQDRAEVFKRTKGYDMPLEDVYYPFYRVVDDSGILTEEQIISQRNRRSAMPDQSHNIEREESSKPFFIRGIDEDLIDIIDDTARYVGMTEPARNAARVLMNPEIKKAIVRVGGEDFHREMMDGLKAASGNKPVTNAIDRWALKLRNKGIGAVVGFNLKMAFMNRVLNFRSTAAYVPGRDWAVGVAQSIAHPFETNKVLMENSALYRDIHDLGSWSELTDVLSDESKGAAANIRKVGAKPMKMGVAAQTRDDMWAAVTQAKREMKEGKASKDVQRALGLEDDKFPPMTAEEQLAGQVKYAEYVAKRIHSSPREIYKGNMTREGIMGTLASTMMSDRNAVLQTGIRLAQDIHTPGGGKRMAKYLLVGVFGEALAYTAISGGIIEGGKEVTAALAGKKPEKKTEREQAAQVISQLIDGMVGNVYGAGDVGYVARKLMTEGNVQINTGQSLVSQFSGDMVDTLTYMKTALSTKNKHIEARAWANAFDSFMSWSLPMVVGVPYKYGLGTAMGVYKESLK